MVSNEQIELSREVDATQIPSGIPHRLSAGTKVRLMQALGGSYTVMTDIGYMVRVDAKDADALGLTPTSAATDAPQEFSENLSGTSCGQSMIRRFQLTWLIWD